MFEHRLPTTFGYLWTFVFSRWKHFLCLNVLCVCFFVWLLHCTDCCCTAVQCSGGRASSLLLAFRGPFSTPDNDTSTISVGWEKINCRFCLCLGNIIQLYIPRYVCIHLITMLQCNLQFHSLKHVVALPLSSKASFDSRLCGVSWLTLTD